MSSKTTKQEMKRFLLEWVTTCCQQEVGVNIIRPGDPEPDRDGRYVDRYGDTWEYDDDADHWCITFVHHGKLAQASELWVTITPDHFPLTEIYA